MVGGGGPGQVQARVGVAEHGAQVDERVHHDLQTLVARQPRQKADHRRSRLVGQRRVSRQIDPVRYHTDRRSVRPEPAFHQIGIERARGNQRVGLAHPQCQLAPARGAKRLGQAVEKAVLPLEAADHPHAQAPLQLADHPRLQGRRQAQDVGPVARQPLAQFVQLLAQLAVLQAQHREGHLAMVARRGHVAVARHPAQQARVVEQAVQPAGRVAEAGEFVLQKHVDPAEKHRRGARACQHLLVQLQRQIHRQQRHLVAGGLQRLGQRVVAHAGPAIPAAGPGC